jgi:hypothetical protein
MKANTSPVRRSPPAPIPLACTKVLNAVNANLAYSVVPSFQFCPISLSRIWRPVVLTKGECNSCQLDKSVLVYFQCPGDMDCIPHGIVEVV